MPETNIADEKPGMPWEEAAQHQERVKAKAAKQFLSIWHAHKDRRDTELKWGEEIEYLLVRLGDGEALPEFCAHKVLQRLGTETCVAAGDPTQCAGWRTEYGDFMVEGVTLPPFGSKLDDVLCIEPALAWRRQELQRVTSEVCGPDVRIVTLSGFPTLGECHEGALEASRWQSRRSLSALCPDEVTSPHPRYQAFTTLWKRKGCKVGAFVPREDILEEQRLSQDQRMQLPFRLHKEQLLGERDPVPGHIYLDCTAFGACQCCAQATFSTRCLEEARFLTDQFLVLAPLFLALTAATPFYRGRVAETDTRWEAFKATWDDRREEELATVPNSRVSANDLFISARLAEVEAEDAALNDVLLPVHATSQEQLLAAGVDPVLARHVAHLLVRDALCLYGHRLDVNDERDADHWEQLQGTNWGTVRFKPPLCASSGSKIGWRVEFRSPEVQPTDFENAAIVGVIRLLAEVIVEERLDLAIPISLCNENEQESGRRAAASSGLFWFRPQASDGSGHGAAGAPRRQRLVEILSAEGSGLFTRCRAWLAGQQASGACSPAAVARLERYMELFERRAAGQAPTPAGLFRARLACHPQYRGDGVLPAAFVRELCVFAAEASGGEAQGPA